MRTVAVILTYRVDESRRKDLRRAGGRVEGSRRRKGCEVAGWDCSTATRASNGGVDESQKRSIGQGEEPLGS
jgi:hypothetical protein